MNQRLTQLTAEMARRQLDAVLITDPKHVYYFTDYATDPHERFLALALSKDTEPFLIVPALELEAARQRSSVQTIVTHTDSEDPYALLKRHLPAGMNAIGIEKDQVSVRRFESIAEALAAKSYADIGDAIRAMRMIKSQDEIERMKHAVRLVEETLREGLKHAAIGVTEMEIAAELEYQMKKRGADGPSFATTVLCGANTALPHGKPGNRKIQAGDLLLLDLGVYANGYASDITRTFAVGELDAELARIYSTVLNANLRAIEAIRPNVSFASVDRAARQTIEAEGYGPYFIHRLGHGLGIDVHEEPSVHERNEATLAAGNVFTVEPGIYIPGRGGVRIEDDVLVTSGGCEVLTTFPKELTVIG
ncbi:Xaa-Pro peptidase family protein [Paenibacillus sp. MSJ-34]|uniref:M24 family metallopeptidase n=1 Tax=Paenibacillus sp. MSJ-34 TaxID=2841529 RepID=UPI001C10E213|nr:Xaa-Pro peptidase family protein [Paenibacillus sp. MSJ-34]MBU5445149.1 Xaa-Pro peptidase family protein [Paenibacillus sp. MSJ-34]